MVLEAGLSQGLEKVLTVHVGEKDPALLTIGPAHDVVKGTDILHSQFARHEYTLRQGSYSVPTIV
jgi:hypothetical protein